MTVAKTLAELHQARREAVSLPAGRRPRLSFVVPAHRRYALTAACLQALRATCDQLADLGVDADAVVAADDTNLDTASACGFHTVRVANMPLGAKWNDAYQRACENGADYLVSLGSDDIVDATVIAAALPGPREISCFRHSAVVSPDAARMALITVIYPGGDGVKIIPAALLAPLGYRPFADERYRALDGSMIDTLRRTVRFRWMYRDVHPLQIVDFKSARDQMTGFDRFERSSRGVDVDQVVDDPFDRLAEVYPEAVLDPIRRVYSRGHTRATVSA